MEIVIPFSDIGPVSFLLGFIEISIEVDHVLSQEALAKVACLELFRSIASLELEVLLLAYVPADLS